MTQEQLASSAGLSRQTIFKIEQGQSQIRTSTLEAVSVALRWPADVLERIQAGEAVADVSGDDGQPGNSEVERSTDALLAALYRLPDVERLRFEAEILEAAAGHVRSQIPEG